MSSTSFTSMFGGAPVLSGDPLGGMTGFGFNIPQGNPGAIEAAARSARGLGQAMSEQASALRAAAGIALEADGGWRGSASAAYAEISGHVEGVFTANAGECEHAAAALAQLAQELSHAQSVTKQALSECEQAQSEMTRQQGIASTSAAEAEGAAKAIAMSPHPAAASALHTQLSSAQNAARNAQNAAAAAEHALQAAKQKGQNAYETYERAAHAAASRISAAAGAIRPAPAISGGAPVPISVTSNDVTMAKVMMAGAGSLPAAAQALKDPEEMYGLGCGPVSPGAVLQFLKEYDEKEQVVAMTAADHQGLDDSVSGVIPGFIGQFAQGVWNGAKQTFQFVTHPSEWEATVTAMLNTSPIYRQIVGGENPVMAQQGAQQSSEALAKGAIDWNDISHGRYAEAAGTIGVGLVGTKGLGDAAEGVVRTAAGVWRDSPFDRPALTESAGTAAGYAGVPYAGNVAQAVAPLTPFNKVELISGAKVAPSQVADWVKSTAATVKGNVAGFVKQDLARTIVNPPDLTRPLLDQMAKVQPDPQIVVTNPPSPPPVKIITAPRIHHG